MTSNNICPICGEGRLHAQLGAQAVEHRGQQGLTAFHYFVCDTCAAEQADPGMLRQNKRLMQAAIARIQWPMLSSLILTGVGSAADLALQFTAVTEQALHDVRPVLQEVHQAIGGEPVA